MNYENVEVNSERWLRLEPLLNEEWKDVPGYEGLYQVSNYGRVKTLKIYNEKNRHQNTKILKASINMSGYYILNLSNKNARVHRLVAKTFILNPNNYLCVNHIDGNKLNNNVNNLEWCTHSHNNKEAYKLGLKKPQKKYGKDNKKSKTIIQYDINGIPIAVFYGANDVKRKLGFCPSDIWACCNNKINTAYGYIWRYEDE